MKVFKFLKHPRGADFQNDKDHRLHLCSSGVITCMDIPDNTKTIWCMFHKVKPKTRESLTLTSPTPNPRDILVDSELVVFYRRARWLLQDLINKGYKYVTVDYEEPA